MVIIVEGCRGTGKTSLCQALSSIFKAPVIRPFRPNMEHHHGAGSEIEANLARWGVPVNTHVDDLYVADILSSISMMNANAHFVLDRSMGSAIAHRSCSDAMATPVLRFWQSLLARSTGVAYVWLRASYAVAAKRVASERPIESDAEYARLESQFAAVFDEMNFHKLALDTSTKDLEFVIGFVARWATSLMPRP